MYDYGTIFGAGQEKQDREGKPERSVCGDEHQKSLFICTL